MGDLHECMWRGIVFYVAAREHFSEVVVLVNLHAAGSEAISFPKRTLQEQYSSVAVVLALLVLFGLEQGLKFIRTHKVTQLQSRVPSIAPNDVVKEENDVVVVVEELSFAKKDQIECFSPNVDKEVEELLEELRIGITEHAPQRAEDGTSGVYFVSNAHGTKRAVFKPADEESIHLEGYDGGEIKPGCMPGEGYLKEVASSLLDKDGFHGVPRTVIAKYAHDVFNNGAEYKVGSLQAFVPSKCTSEDMGASKFSTRDVHKIGLLDCRILNLDRHLGNMLVTEKEGVCGLVPIDHALSMPSTITGGTFEWLQFPQCKQPFDDETVNFVCNIDADSDVNMLRQQLPDLKEECIDTMKLCTLFLKKAVAKRFTLYEIGCMMSRYRDEDVPSNLEKLYIRVRDRMAREETPFWRLVDEEIDRVLVR